MVVQALPAVASSEDINQSVIEENILGKRTASGRSESLRRLKRLYGLDRTKPLFRVFWTFAHDEPKALSQLCLLSAFARDPQLRHSFDLIRIWPAEQILPRAAMEEHLNNGYPGRFTRATLVSMAQNVNTTWTVSGHLSGKVTKVRTLPEPTATSAAYAMFVGYLAGLRGVTLLTSVFGELVSPSRAQLQSALNLAAAKGLLSLRQAADVVEFDFSTLLTRTEQELLHESS